ncbi:type II secretion system F family protein [Thalassotalea ponticola]|uniref:type II secretion system F family protein n=1 Tax=Thalassotalea ponticola TaxID=1523392 RepID=UPI0025B375AC|nr:type II secretion system F family protein [Thalassotalea ponticola]MDN3651724.1 type II secretion system F family protein [Thalassotalea ponticola]
MSTELTFLLLIFGAVIFMSQTLLVSVYSPQRAKTKMLKNKLKDLADSGDTQLDLIKAKRLEKLPPALRYIEAETFVGEITSKLEMGGSKLFGYQYILFTLLIIAVVSPLVWTFTRDWIFVVAVAAIICFGAYVKLNRDITKRFEKIEEQFPEALDVLKRGLQAGYAFSEALKLVCEESQGELAYEFNLMFHQINFGNDIKTALYNFVNRVPITSAMAFASAVSIQKETGGNLAEKIETLSRVIRQRFNFKRKVKTLSAEGRLSAWILVLTPFFLFAMLHLVSPGYLTQLVASEEGIDLLKFGLISMMVGIYWISKLIQIEV